jgi:acyl CoA:acetate/3-ketoacid CoA transferase beta subunit
VRQGRRDPTAIANHSAVDLRAGPPALVADHLPRGSGVSTQSANGIIGRRTAAPQGDAGLLAALAKDQTGPEAVRKQGDVPVPSRSTAYGRCKRRHIVRRGKREIDRRFPW